METESLQELFVEDLWPEDLEAAELELCEPPAVLDCAELPRELDWPQLLPELEMAIWDKRHPELQPLLNEPVSERAALDVVEPPWTLEKRKCTALVRIVPARLPLWEESVGKWACRGNR